MARGAAMGGLVNVFIVRTNFVLLASFYLLVQVETQLHHVHNFVKNCQAEIILITHSTHNSHQIALLGKIRFPSSQVVGLSTTS
jgi:hypothetical protein